MSTDVTHAHGGAEHHNHPSASFYVLIGVVLAAVMGVKVAIFYIEAMAAFKAPILVVLSTVKVLLVVMFFMHLKMEPRFLTWVFMAGVVLATFMVGALMVIYHVLPRFGGM